MNDLSLPLSFWDSWGEAATIVVAAGVIVFLATRALSAYRAYLASRATAAAESQYRKLAEEVRAAITDSRETSEQNAAILSDLRDRLASVETLLRQVE